MNWSVDPATGHYRTSTPTPTGIPSDPQLASYGCEQAEQLGEHIVTLDPPVDVVYSSPFYRCLQTIRPAVERLIDEGRTDGKVRVENGVGFVVPPFRPILNDLPSRLTFGSEFFGLARFEHPSPAPTSTLSRHFSFLSSTHKPAIIPSITGESLPGIHDRHAYALNHIIRALDNDPSAPRALLICTHAASMICIGRVLTGHSPTELEEEDFRCGTCALSTFVRRGPAPEEQVEVWDEKEPNKVPVVDWKSGKGVGGGWDCTVNGDCSFLSGGEERTW